MNPPASDSILSLFWPFPASSLRGKSDARRLGRRIILGSVAQPYLPEEGRRDLAQLGEILRHSRDARDARDARDGQDSRERRGSSKQDARPELTLSITTRSPLLLHDLELLTELDRDHVVSVDVLLPALDPEIVRQLEPHLQTPPDPRSRLELVRRLADEGIATRVLCVPLAPNLFAVTASLPSSPANPQDPLHPLPPLDPLKPAERRLEALFAAAREAGAWDLVTDLAAASGAGRPGRRNRFRAWKRWSSSPLPLPPPRLHTRGQRHPQAALSAAAVPSVPSAIASARESPPGNEADALLATFRRLRIEYGFPRSTPGRG